MSYKLLTIPLSEEEENFLRRAASQQCRRPRDHARFVLLEALGISQAQGNVAQLMDANNAVNIREDRHDVVAKNSINSVL